MQPLITALLVLSIVDQCRLDLRKHLITLQQTLITLLQRSTNATDIVLPDHATLTKTSNATCARVIETLVRQYQRMSSAASVPKLLSSDGQCTGKISRVPGSGARCDRCRAKWHVVPKHSVLEIGSPKPRLEALAKWHAEDTGKLTCRVCHEYVEPYNGAISPGTFPGPWKEHLNSHSSTELRRAWKMNSGDRNCTVM